MLERSEALDCLRTCKVTLCMSDNGMRKQSLSFLVFALSCWFAPCVQARNVDPGTLTAAFEIGPSFRLDNSLSGSRAYALMAGEVDYAFTKNLSTIVDVGVGLGSGTPLRLHVGGRWRWADLGSPLSPFVQAQLGMGWLFDILGADLGWFGVRMGAGIDYFITERWGAGIILDMDLGSTTAARSAFFGTFDIIARISAAF